MMKILHVVRNLEIGGMERVVVELARQQVADGHCVFVYEVDGCEGARLPLPDGVGHQCGPAQAERIPVRVTRQLLAIMRREHFDVVHAHNMVGLRHAWLPARLARRRLVLTKHGMDFSPGLYRWLYRHADAVACVSEPIAQRFREVFPDRAERMTLIPNGISMPATMHDRPGCRAALGLAGDPFVLLWVGRMVPEKGLDVLLPAIQQLDPREFVVLLAGDGPERCALEALAASGGVHDRVRFLGMQRDLSCLYAAADCFTLPSRTEGLPMALLEAGMAGLPVIVSDVGAMPGIVKASGGGWIEAPEDPDALASVLRAAWHAGAEARSMKGQSLAEHVRNHYTVKQMAARYEDIYGAIMKP